MTEREALKLALEALEDAQYFVEAELNDRMDLYKNYPNLAHKYAGEQESLRKNQEAITAIKEALNSPNGEAQPEQHQDWCASLTQLLMSMPPKPAPCNCKPPQRIWVGLTEEEVEACFHHVDEAGIGLFDFAEAVEAKLKQKNGYAEEKNT